MAWALLACFAAAPAGAQQPASGTAVTGLVLDAVSGDPVAGAFLSIGESGPRAIADAEGRFRITNVPLGTQRLSAERFGYQRLELVIEVTPALGPIELRMRVDPIQLRGLTVPGGARAALSGVVLDARSGAPIPWATLTLTKDAVRDDARTSADDQGIFRTAEVETGGYLLRIERLGYVSQYLQVRHATPPSPLEVRLEPDSAVMAGLAVMAGELRHRRNAAAYIVQAYDERRLRYSAAPSVRSFLEWEAGLSFQPCGGSSASLNCMVIYGRAYAPRVIIDELGYPDGLDMLWSYDTDELHSVEVFRCRPPQIRVYTHQYMERVARKPRALEPTCIGF